MQLFFYRAYAKAVEWDESTMSLNLGLING